MIIRNFEGDFSFMILYVKGASAAAASVKTRSIISSEKGLKKQYLPHLLLSAKEAT